MEQERGYQRYPRFTKRLEVTFSSGGTSFKGILSNISQNGVFIRTNRGFAPGTTVDIQVVMPDNSISHLAGIVRRTVKTPLTAMKNGMGVELTKKDLLFTNFMKAYSRERTSSSKAPEVFEFQIIPCANCGVKNKVLTAKIPLGPRCGKCGMQLLITMP
jgi:hypothetical protein